VIGVTPAIDGTGALDGLLVVNTVHTIFEALVVRVRFARNRHSIRAIGA
jgi:hypothetical protein